MIDRIAEIKQDAEAAIRAAKSTDVLEQARVRYLGRKAELPNMLRQIATLAPVERGPTGKAANQLRQQLETLIEQREAELAKEELDERLQTDRVDVTLPGDPLPAIGRL